MLSEDSVDEVNSQIVLAAAHLDRAAESQNLLIARDHTANAREIYEELLRLLPAVRASGKDRVRLVTDVARLRDRLRAVGEEV